MMTRKNFKAIAEAVKRAKNSVANFHEPSANTAFSFVEMELMDVFAKENPNFDRARFREACTLPQE